MNELDKGSNKNTAPGSVFIISAHKYIVILIKVSLY